MEELSLNVDQQAGVIKTNLKEIKEALAVQMTAYTSLEVTEDSTKEAKKDLAVLRKIRAAFDDKRKEIKKQFMEPYEQFNNEVAELLDIIDEPINLIDKKIKDFDVKRAEEKKKVVEELYENVIGEYREYLPFDVIFKKQWINSTTKEKDIEFDLSEMKTRVMSELNTIKALNSEIEDEIIETYKKNGNNLAIAVQRNSQYLQDKQRVKNQVEAEVKAEVREEVKPNAEAMGELNNIIHAMKTVKFIVAEEDAQRVENMLSFEDIRYRRVEE